MQSYAIIFDSQPQVETFTPDIHRFLQYSQKNNVPAVAVTAKGDGEYDYVYRVFAPMMGVNEDSGTGIANCLFGHYWGEVLGKKEMWVGQPSERFSEMIVHLVEDGVRITGSATPLIKGTISI